MTKVYSLDGTVYSLDGALYTDWDSMISDIENNTTLKNGDTLEIFEAERVPYTHADFVNAECIIDEMAQCAYDRGGEYADSYLSDIDAAAMAELKNLIVDWLDEKADRPTFFTVKNVRAKTIRIEER